MNVMPVFMSKTQWSIQRLAELLENGPVPAEVAIRACVDGGVCRARAFAARRSLGCISIKIDGMTYWMLPAEKEEVPA